MCVLLFSVSIARAAENLVSIISFEHDFISFHLMFAIEPLLFDTFDSCVKNL